MESQSPSSNVDTSRPFRSVKEAVAIFGEQRLLIGFKSPPPPPPPKLSPPPPPKLSPSPLLLNKPEIKNSVESEEIRVCSIDEQEEEIEYSGGRDGEGFGEGLKKLEAELAETKKELRLLKEREMETEVAVAALNAELHKSMSRMAMAEASAAAKAATPTRSLAVGLGMGSMEGEYSSMNRSPIVIASHEEIKHYPRLSEILSIGDQMSKKKNKKMMTTGMKKQKPIVPLVGDLLSLSISSWKRS